MNLMGSGRNVNLQNMAEDQQKNHGNVYKQIVAVSIEKLWQNILRNSIENLSKSVHKKLEECLKTNYGGVAIDELW